MIYAARDRGLNHWQVLQWVTTFLFLNGVCRLLTFFFASLYPLPSPSLFKITMGATQSKSEPVIFYNQNVPLQVSRRIRIQKVDPLDKSNVLTLVVYAPLTSIAFLS
jgi:hypothetical protein